MVIGFYLFFKFQDSNSKRLYTNLVTHVVYGSGKTCNRTLNYLKAILMGIWVVNVKCKSVLKAWIIFD